MSSGKKKTASPTTAWGGTGSHHAALPLTESLCVTRHNLCLWSEWVREREVEMSALPQTCPLVWREEGFGCGRLIKVTAWIFRSKSVLWICKWQSLCRCEHTHTQCVHVRLCACAPIQWLHMGLMGHREEHIQPPQNASNDIIISLSVPYLHT